MTTDLKYLTADNDLLSYVAEDGRTVVLEPWMPEFGRMAALGPAPFVPPAPTAPDLLATLAARRYAAQISGTMLGENRLATDDATRAMLHAARTKIAEDPAYVIPAWKFSPGVFAPLDAATIIAAGDAVFDHVQACFANEARLSALILAATTPEALSAIDLDAGWP